jgi:hypothetical protein
VWWWGARGWRHWLVDLWQRPSRPSTAVPDSGFVLGLGVVWRGGVGAAGVGGEAPCWVLKEQPVGRVALGLLFRVPGVAGSCIPGYRVRDRCGDHRVVVAGGGGLWWLLVWGWWLAGWLLVENCIVDASIFVVKLSRADGGCLGTRSR